MPISEPTAAVAQDDYAAARAAFRAAHVRAKGRAGAVQAFHAVRNLAYFSGPDRTPLAALRTGRGACTAKHILLRDLLRDLGLEAEVELVDCDFAAALPQHPDMPEDLRVAIAAGGVRDVHCWVRLRDGAKSLRLDATFPDALGRYGFALNDRWDDASDTAPAAPDAVSLGTAEDVIGQKEALLARLGPAEAAARKAFLARLSAWMQGLAVDDRGGKTG